MNPNHRDRLASAGSGSATSTYAYDHEDTRIRKATGVATTTYPNQYFETAGATTTSHVYLPDGTLIATIVATSTATSTTYVHADHLGSTNVTTDSNGDVVQTLDYYPFGDERIDSSTGVDETRKFVGMERDDESGLDYATAGYYDNARGQFLSQDPSFLDIGAAGFEQNYGRTLQMHLANPQALNSYSWALNNPIILKDPDGEIVPLLIGAYIAAEFALSAYDAYSTAATLADPNASGGEKAFSAGGFVAGLALPGAGYGTAANKAAQLAKNAEQGKAFENVVGKLFGKDNAVTAKQVTIQAKDGTKTRVDFIGRDACGNCSIIEAKSSQTAPLTKNQQSAFPQIGQSGGTVVGAGKPGFPGGTQIPPTKVDVVRP